MADVPALYKDLGKKSRDLLSKNFPDSFNFEVNQNCPVPWKFNTFQRAKGSSFEFEASKELVVPVLNLPTKVTVFTESFDKIYVDGQVENFFLEGLKTNLRETIKRSSGSSEYKFSNEYKRALASSTFSITRSKKSVANGSLVLGGSQGLLVGADTELSIDTKQVNSSALALGWISKDFEATAFTKFGGNRVITFNLWSNVGGSSTLFASEFNVEQGGTPTGRFGLQKALTAVTTGKLRWDTRNKLALSVVTQLNPGLELTLAQEVDFQNGNVAQVGFSITFK